MKHYRDNLLLIVSNIVTEYILLVLTYIACAAVRTCLPASIAKPFHMFTTWHYLPFVIIVSVIIICMYLLLGDYDSIHFRSKVMVFIETFFVNLIGGALISALLYVVQSTTFSRWLLTMMIVSWTFIISLKRIGAAYVARRWFGGKLECYRVLVLGRNDSAERYVRILLGKTSYGYVYVGYIAGEETEHLNRYLGDYGDLNDVIRNNGVNRVVITEDNLTRRFLNDVLTICAVYGIEASIIPAYSDFLASGQTVRSVDDLHVLKVNAHNCSNILGVKISVTNMDSTVADIVENLDKWRGEYVCVSNVHTTVMAHDDENYRNIQNGAVIALPDGGPLSSYSRSTGQTDAKRVTGPDLMKELLKRSGEYGWSHFFYGSTEKTLKMLKEKIEKDYPGAKIAGMISPPYREITPEEDEKYVRQINESNPDFVWVGLGAPKQEIWMAAHKGRINALMFGVGAAFDYESGNLKRAPKWMQKCNLEWLYRLMQEPKRLFKRYFVTNIKFLWLTRR